MNTILLGIDVPNTKTLKRGASFFIMDALILIWSLLSTLQARDCLSIKMSSYQYRYSHYENKTVSSLYYIKRKSLYFEKTLYYIKWKSLYFEKTLYWNRVLMMVNNVQWLSCQFMLTHCSLVMPYGTLDMGQRWLREWLVAWWHQFWLNTNEVLWHSPGGNFTINAQDMYHWYEVEIYKYIITTPSRRANDLNKYLVLFFLPAR